jgi:hypothetical protein
METNMMRRGAAIQIYKSLPVAEQQAFKQWARVNTVIFTMLAGMLATSLAIASSAATLPQVAATSTTLPK